MVLKHSRVQQRGSRARPSPAPSSAGAAPAGSPLPQITSGTFSPACSFAACKEGTRRSPDARSLGDATSLCWACLKEDSNVSHFPHFVFRTCSSCLKLSGKETEVLMVHFCSFPSTSTTLHMKKNCNTKHFILTSDFKHKGGGDLSYCWRNHFY